MDTTVSLSDDERQFYGSLFSLIDVQNDSTIPISVGLRVLSTSGLSEQQIIEILEVCGAHRLGYFGRSQFYLALKLIAAVQAGYDLSLDMLSSGMEIPLPRVSLNRNAESSGGVKRNSISHPAFDPSGSTNQASNATSSVATVLPGSGVETNHSSVKPPKQEQHTPESIGSPGSRRADQKQGGFHKQTDSRQLPPPPPFSNKKQQRTMESAAEASDYQQAPVSSSAYSQHATIIPPRARVSRGQRTSQTNDGEDFSSGSSESSARHSSVAPPSIPPPVLPPNSSSLQHPVVFEDARSLSSVDTESLASIDEFFHITEEQRDYYRSQFQRLQPDLRGVIPGSIAKEFFETSRLPTQELSIIWNLSDVNKDGALSLAEFCAAMHLVVLRKNEFDLPANLPPSLHPSQQRWTTNTTGSTEAGVSAQASSRRRLTPVMPASNGPENSFENEPFSSDLPPGRSDSDQHSKHGDSPASPISAPWPQTSSSNQGSASKVAPSPLANFDFQPADSTKMAHPTPLRVMGPGAASMEMQQQLQSTGEPAPPPSVPLPPRGVHKQRSMTEGSVEFDPGALYTPAGMARPRPKPAGESIDRPEPGHLLQPPPSLGEAGPSTMHQRSGSTTSSTSSTSSSSGVETKSAARTGASAKVEEHVSGTQPSSQYAVDQNLHQHSRKRSDHRRQRSLDFNLRAAPSSSQSVDQHHHQQPHQHSFEETLHSSSEPRASIPGSVDYKPGGKKHDRSFGRSKFSQSRPMSMEDFRAQIRRLQVEISSQEKVNSELNMEIAEVMDERISLEVELEHMEQKFT